MIDLRMYNGIILESTKSTVRLGKNRTQKGNLMYLKIAGLYN